MLHGSSPPLGLEKQAEERPQSPRSFGNIFSLLKQKISSLFRFFFFFSGVHSNNESRQKSLRSEWQGLYFPQHENSLLPAEPAWGGEAHSSCLSVGALWVTRQPEGGLQLASPRPGSPSASSLDRGFLLSAFASTTL